MRGRASRRPEFSPEHRVCYLKTSRSFMIVDISDPAKATPTTHMAGIDNAEAWSLSVGAAGAAGAANVAGEREPHHCQPSMTILPRAVVLSSAWCARLRFAALMGENRSVRVVRTSPASTRLAMADRI